MSIMFRRIRGRAAGCVIVVNPLLVREIQPTVWGGSEIYYDDLHVTVSRDAPAIVTRFLEGRQRLCETALCDRTTVTPYSPVCARCQGPNHSRVSDSAGGDYSPRITPRRDSSSTTAGELSPIRDAVIVNGRHGFA